MTEPRIAIVGGGPAGSATALNLLHRGVDPADVVIYDRARFPRPKLCGGALTYRGTQSLARLIGEPAGGARTQGLVLRSALGQLTVREPGPQWLYDRALLDDRLLAACKAAGVAVREGAAVTGLTPVARGWRLRLGAGRPGAGATHAWVVGADGAGGISRRAAGLPGGRFGRLVEGVYELAEPERLPAGAAPDQLYFDFDPVLEGIPGYGWIFPYPCPERPGERLWKLGIMDGRGVVPGARLRAWAERFAARHGFRLADDRLAGWPERYYHRRSRGHRPGLILVGEAFGIDPLLGEGIAPVFGHAAYAAGRLRGALDAGRSVIGGYEAGFLRTEEGWNLFFHQVLADHLYGAGGRRWLEVLFRAPGLARLGASGRAAYGRLGRMPLKLSAIFAAARLRTAVVPGPAPG